MSASDRCYRCKEPIDGQAISIDGRLYHPACFTCSTCGIQLSGQFKDLEDGRYVCPDCVPRPICKACRQPIVGGIIDLDGDKYHPDCARCEICTEQLCGEYGIVRGVLRCKACMTATKPQRFKRTSRKKESVICVGCQQRVLAEFVFGDPEDTFHEGCFLCAQCGNKLDQFAVDKSGGKKRYLCATCFYGDDVPEDQVDLRQELESLDLPALQERAIFLGATEEELKSDEDDEVKKNSMIELILSKSTEAPPTQRLQSPAGDIAGPVQAPPTMEKTNSLQPPTMEKTSSLQTGTNSLQVPTASFQMGKVNSFNMAKSFTEASSFASAGKKSCLKRRNSNEARSVMFATDTDNVAQVKSFGPKSVQFSDFDQMHEYKVKDNRSSIGSTASSRQSLEQEQPLVLNQQEPGCCERCTRCVIM